MENVNYRRGFQRSSPGQALGELKSAITLKAVILQISCFAVSVLLGYGTAFENMSPFGMAMVISVPTQYSLAVLLGSCGGYLLSQSGVLIIRYIVSTVCLWVIRNRIIGKNSRYSEVWFVPPLVSLFVCVCTGAAFMFSAEVSSDIILMFLGEAVLCAFSVYFFKKTISVIRLAKEKSNFSVVGLSCVAVSFGIIIMCLNSLNIGEFSFARTLACFATVVCAYVIGEAGGGACAATCSFALYASSAGENPVFPIALSGLVCGVFSPLGKGGCVISFTLIYSVLCLFSQNVYYPVLLAECASAMIVFAVIPKKVYKTADIFFKRKNASYNSANVREDISLKLLDAAKTIENVSDGITEVSEKLKKINKADDKNVYCRIREEFCTQCDRFHECWETSFAYTLRVFNDLSNTFHENDRLFESDLPKLFSGKCDRKSDLLIKAEDLFRKNMNSAFEEINLGNMRELLSDQIKCTSEMLVGFSKDFSRCSLNDNTLSSEIKGLLKTFGINVLSVVCMIDTRGNMTITVKAKRVCKNLDKAKLKNEIENIALRKFNNPEFSFLENGITIVFKQKPWMNLVTGKSQLSSDDSPICGDCYREYYDDGGKRTMIISDGMGTGGRAAVDAAMASEYFSNLIKSGISYNCALKIVNSALSVKSTNESLATIDVASVDLFSGKIEFFKAGAAVSFVRKSGKCEIIESVSLPAGILRDISFATENVTLCKGDIIVMVTDGVTNYGTDWIVKEIENWNHSDPENLARRITGIVCEKSREERRDDITVVAGIMTA